MKSNYLALIAAIALTTGCASKSKNTEVTGSGERVEVESADLTAQGSDSGKISGLYTVNFDFDKSTLNDGELKKLALNALGLKSNPTKSLLIEGHTDSQGSNEYNLALGERRAVYVKNQLAKLGVSSGKLSIISFGEEKALSAGHTDEDMAKNRRANFVPN